jgi:hypothetical protein
MQQPQAVGSQGDRPMISAVAKRRRFDLRVGRADSRVMPADFEYFYVRQ